MNSTLRVSTRRCSNRPGSRFIVGRGKYRYIAVAARLRASYAEKHGTPPLCAD